MATTKRTIKRDDAAEIAGHISAILNNPATPVDIYNALADAVCDLDMPKGYWNTVEYMMPLIAKNIRKGDKADG